VGLFVPGCRLLRCNDRLLTLGQTRCSRRRALLAKALGGENHPHPRVINTDKYAAYPPAIVQRLKKQMRLVKNPSVATRRDTALIAALCAAPARGTPLKWPENCLKIAGHEVLLWGTSIEEPCFAISLRFWHAWRQRLARPDQRRLYRKSFL
jgi:hypothetical protein